MSATTIIDSDEKKDDAVDAAASDGAEQPSEAERPPMPDAAPDVTQDAIPDATPSPATEPPFDAPLNTAPADAPDADDDALFVNIEGYEGPLDILLELARKQKVDLRRISILALVEQYLAFIEAAKARRLELAADYLVMASWLAFLKTKLLLPAPTEAEDEPTADEMAARLAFQLQRLEAMRASCVKLFALPQMGEAVFGRGAPTGVEVSRTRVWRADLYDLLKAYARQRVAGAQRDYSPAPPAVFSIEEARARLARILGDIPDWVDLRAIAPQEKVDVPPSSVIASALNAALEFAKAGRMELRQLGNFEPIYVRRRDEPPQDDHNNENGEDGEGTS